jgi:hypothetical protein
VAGAIASGAVLAPEEQVVALHAPAVQLACSHPSCRADTLIGLPHGRGSAILSCTYKCSACGGDVHDACDTKNWYVFPFSLSTCDLYTLILSLYAGSSRTVMISIVIAFAPVVMTNTMETSPSGVWAHTRLFILKMPPWAESRATVTGIPRGTTSTCTDMLLAGCIASNAYVFITQPRTLSLGSHWAHDLRSH